MSIEVRVTPLVPRSAQHFRIASDFSSVASLPVLQNVELVTAGDTFLNPSQEVPLSALQYVQCVTMSIEVREFLQHLLQERPDLQLLGARSWAALKAKRPPDFMQRVRTTDAIGKVSVLMFAAACRKDGELLVPRIRYRPKQERVVWSLGAASSFQTPSSGFLALSA